MLFLTACGSGTGAGSSGSAVDGLYSIQETVTSSSCAADPVGKTGGDTISITSDGDTITESIDSITGSCAGSLNGDRATWSCQITTSSGAVVTLQIEATFSGNTISGTFVLGGSCQIEESFSGSRQ
jgi:hypothetical protein